MNKTVMILGGGTMQIPSIKIAKKKGWRVIVADGNPVVEGRKYADFFANIDLKDINGMEKAARHYHDLFGLHGVFTAGTDFSTTVAYIAEKLNLPGIPYQVACKATNKSLMRSAFKIHSVPCPDYYTISPGDDPLIALEHLALPLVVKPVDNMGSRGVRRVNSRDELIKAVFFAREASFSNTVIIEEFMEGPELSLDAIVYNDIITMCGIADRHIFFPPYFVEMGHTMPTNLPHTTIMEVIDIFSKGIKALGITNGAAKGDIIVTDQGPKIGEIAARLSGGYMSGWTYPFSSGIEVTEAALQIAVGLPPGNLRSKHQMVSAERAIISIPGIVSSINNVEKAQSSEKIREVFIRIQPGDPVQFPQNNVQKCGNIISRAETREQAIEACEKAMHQIEIRLEPGIQQTDKFLFPKTMDTVHTDSWYNSLAAFTIHHSALRKALEKMFIISGAKDNNDPERISIAPLAGILEQNSKDWHGKTIQNAFADVCSAGNVSLSSEEKDDHLVLGRVFWESFLKGGSQGGLYIIDTIRKALKESPYINHIIKRWIP